jgi:hypothetical protein
MTSKYEYLKEIDIKIKLLEQTTNELSAMGKDKEIPAIYKNTRRILASTRLLKLNISDILDFKL